MAGTVEKAATRLGCSRITVLRWLERNGGAEAVKAKEITDGTSALRPASLTNEQRRDVAQRLKDGAAGVSALSRVFKTSRQTIMRIRDGASAA